MVDEKTANHDRNRTVRADLTQKRDRKHEQAHLADRGIAQETLHLALSQADQIREQEGDPATQGNDPILCLEERKKLEKGEEHAGRYADREHGGNAARRRLVDIQTPAIRRERLELDDQTGQKQQQARMRYGAVQFRAARDQFVDIQCAGCMVEQDRAEQEICRGNNRRNDVFECRGHGARILLQPQQSVSCDGNNLKKDKEIEQIAGHHHAADAHRKNEIKQKRRIISAQSIP